MNDPHDVVESDGGNLKGLIAQLKLLAEGLRKLSHAPTETPQSNEAPVLRLYQGDYMRDFNFEDDNS